MAGVCAGRVLQVHIQGFVFGEESVADGLNVGGVALQTGDVLSLSANVPAVGERGLVGYGVLTLTDSDIIQRGGCGTEERGLRLRGQRRRREGRRIEETLVVVVGVRRRQDVAWELGAAGDDIRRGLRVRQRGGTFELHIIAGRVLDGMLVEFPSQGCDGQAFVVVVEGNGGGGLLRAEVGGSGAGETPGEPLRGGGPRRWTSRGKRRDEGAITIDHKSVIPFQGRARLPGGRGGGEGEVFEHGGAISDFTPRAIERSVFLCDPLEDKHRGLAD